MKPKTFAEVLEKIGVADQWISIGEARGVALGEARGEARGVTLGEARGKVGGKREAVVSFLQARFGKVPQNIVHAVNACSDTSDLDVLTVSAATCKTLKEFAAGLK